MSPNYIIKRKRKCLSISINLQVHIMQRKQPSYVLSTEQLRCRFTKLTQVLVYRKLEPPLCFWCLAPTGLPVTPNQKTPRNGRNPIITRLCSWQTKLSGAPSQSSNTYIPEITALSFSSPSLSSNRSLASCV